MMLFTVGLKAWQIPISFLVAVGHEHNTIENPDLSHIFWENHSALRVLRKIHLKQ